MCKPQSEGGQRCAAHTRTAMLQATDQFDRTNSLDDYDRLQAARADHASTPSGRREFQVRLEALTPTSGEAIDLQQALRRGELIRERNTAVAAALKPSAPAQSPFERAQDPATSWQELDRLFRAHPAGHDRETQMAVLMNPSTAAVTLKAGVASNDREFLYAVARHTRTVPDTLEYLASDPHFDIRIAVAENPHTPTRTGILLAEDRVSAVRRAAATRTDLPAGTVDSLVHDESEYVRAEVVTHHDLTEGQEAHIEEIGNKAFSQGEDHGGGDDLFALAARTRNVDRQIRMAKQGFPSGSLLDNPHLDKKALHEVARNHGDWPDSLHRVIDHPNVSTSTLLVLREHADAGVRSIAHRRLGELAGTQA
jgi:hypothetical protein